MQSEQMRGILLVLLAPGLFVGLYYVRESSENGTLFLKSGTVIVMII